MWPLTNGVRCLEGDEASLFRGAVGMMLDQLIIGLNADPIDFEFFDDDSASTLDDQPIAAQMGGLPDWLSDSADELVGEVTDKNGSEREDIGFEEGFGFESPHWFSMWEPDQRIWLLERVATSMLTAKPAPPASAVFEATVEAVYVELADLIAMEITAGTPIQKGSWRASLLDAYVQRCPKDSLLGALQFEATTLDSCLPPSIQKQLRSLEGDVDSDADPDASIDEQPGNQDWLNWWTSVIERLVNATYGPRIYHEAERLRDGDPQEIQRYLRGKGVNSKFLHRIPPLRTPQQTQATVDRLQSIVFRSE